MNLNRPVDFYECYSLPQDEVHIWRTGLDITESDLAELRQVLLPEEQERADRFHLEADRRRRAMARISAIVAGQNSDSAAKQVAV